ncbi:RND family transporter [Hoyosella altamirensis]|uniref:RND superfamily putative drug exporter n=1 Tax=Hoyosella altamirensis TaxID=616997 RepID=A0A839RNF7_9ACTN|nr:RND family transporter [Hoyosella altamirensis]MBB3037596.1 RND superfamily putative drug exporter [Hoyosella altamirensis]
MVSTVSSAFSRVGAAAAKYAWWVAGFWVIALVTLNVLFPQLEKVIADNSAAFIPENNQASIAITEMSRDFGNPDSSAVGFFVMANENGFGDADRAYYDALAKRLVDSPDHVAYILDLQTTPEARELSTSEDGKAVTLMTVLHGDNGTTEATQATSAVREIASSIDKPDGLDVKFSGPVATTSDQLQAVEHGMLVITGVSVILISIALLFAYRRVMSVAFALLILGFGLGLARPVVGILGQAGILEMSMFTAALMTALVIGAGTDYAVFIIGRFHEARRSGRSLPDAIADAVGGIATVIIASGLTIAAACMAMLFTEVGIFRTAGPPIAVGILISLTIALTLGPALLAILGRRGGADPLMDGGRKAERRWRRIGARVVHRPLTAFFLCIAVITPLVAVAFTYEPNFDEFSAQPADSESNQGYQLANNHFPYNELLPEYVIVRTDHDMRTSADLAALELIAQSVSQVEGVSLVRSITRPDGTPLPEASLGYQAGIVADGLTEATERIAASQPELLRLAEGTTELADGAETARQRLPELVTGTDEVTGLANDILTTVELLEVTVDEASGGEMDLGGAVAEIHTTAYALSDVAGLLASNAAAITTSSGMLNNVFGPALRGGCGDLQCSAVHAALQRADDATGGNASQALRSAIDGGQNLDETTARISALSARMHQIASQLETSLGALADQGSTASARERLTDLTAGVRELADGVGQLAAGAREISDGTQRIPQILNELAQGLQLASGHLGGMRTGALNGPGSGFYLPDFALEEPRFVTASQFFLSPDGKTARMVALSGGSVLSRESFDRIDAMRAAAQSATDNTVLHDADVTSTSFAAVYSDLEGEINSDFRLVALIALAAVTLILVAMLRSIVAPLVIMVWALVSYIATIGIGVVVWQHLLGVPLHWSVIPISFVVLVGVGADYSMLVITRIREESAATLRGVRSPDGGLRLGVIRALGSTGGVITVAGVVFAITMFALMSGGVYLLAQLGFVVGIGLILDILLVRTVLVPSTLLLLGKVSWWPARS